MTALALALEDELARIASDVQALAIRHGITHAAAIDTPNLIRALQTIVRRQAEDVAILRALRGHDPNALEARRHEREVAAVRASLLLGDPTERHNCYARRAARTA